MNATRSGVTNNMKIPNSFERDGHENMENMVISIGLPVVKASDSQQIDKGKGVVSFNNGLDLAQVADSCREKGIVLKEAKRRRADIVLDGLGQSEEDVQLMGVDPKSGLAVGPVFQAHRDQSVP